VNTFFIFQILKIENFQILQYEHIANSTDFSNLQTQFLAICLNFEQQNPLKNEYLPHLSSKNCEIMFY